MSPLNILAQDGGAASSKTYRFVVKEMAKKLKVKPINTRFPSDDFAIMADLIPEKIKRQALKWYEIGIRRGLTKATEMMLDGKMHKEGSTLYCPRKFEVNVKTRFSGGKWISRKYRIRATDIGFK
jgi:hypothetical protein